jgi:hypothetical protein
LLDLSFVEETQGGLRPHDVARDVLEADLRWRDPEAYADIHRRLRAYLVDNIRSQTGNPENQQQAAAELLYLARGYPLLGPYWDWDALGEGLRQPVGPEQAELVVALTRAAQGEQQAELAAHWLRVQPEAFRLFRTPDGEAVGYAACLALHRARPEDIEPIPVQQLCGGTPSSIGRLGPGSRCWLGASTLIAILTKVTRACRERFSGPGISRTCWFDRPQHGSSTLPTPIWRTGSRS